MTVARFEVEVLASHEGRAAVRIAGHKVPLLLLDSKIVAELEQLFAAATLRIKALGDTAASDAITEFMKTFQEIISEFDVERKRYGSEMSSRIDQADLLEELQSDLNFLRSPPDDVPK